jgi:hypothetical protein
MSGLMYRYQIWKTFRLLNISRSNEFVASKLPSILYANNTGMQRCPARTLINVEWLRRFLRKAPYIPTPTHRQY